MSKFKKFSASGDSSGAGHAASDVAGGAGVWKTKDGREIPIGEMGDTHLLRSIRMLEGRLVDVALIDPKNDRDSEYREFVIEKVTGHLKQLKAEAEKRKLLDWGKFGVTLPQKVLD